MKQDPLLAKLIYKQFGEEKSVKAWNALMNTYDSSFENISENDFKELLDNSPETYLVDSNITRHRNADYDKRNLIVDKWESVEVNEEGTCGNINSEFIYHVSDEKWVDRPAKLGWMNTDFLYMHNVISSQLLLYRLCSTFPCKVDSIGPNGYKVVWVISLKHKETGELVNFSEWKGAASFRSKFMSAKDLPESLKNDLLEILDYLCSETCAHPYNGLVAGAVA